MVRPQSQPQLETCHTYRAFACQRCSQRKKRCDRVLPACTPCRLSGETCGVSSREKNVVRVKGSEVVRKGYVTSLLEDIAALQDQIARAGITSPHLTDGSAPAQAQQLPSPVLESQQQRAPAAADIRWPLEGNDANVDRLSRSAMAEPRGRAGEFLKQLSMPRIIAGITETYGGDPEATKRMNPLWHGISQYIRHPHGQAHRLYVEPSEADKALGTYLELVDFRFPRLPITKVATGFSAITHSDESLYKQQLATDPACIFMAYMVIAIVPLVSDDYPISEGSFVSIQLLGKCLKVLDRVFRQEDGVDIIQCLHLLVIFSVHCSAAGSAWHLVGFAMNKCISLGYHRERAADSPEAEERRWAFWSCYFLDRLISSALGRPCSIDDRCITVSLPGSDTALHTPKLKDSFHSHLFCYSQLVSSVISDRSNEDFGRFLGRLLHWRTLTPPHSDPEAREPYLHQTSLFNTLMLRIAIREILSSYKFHEPPHEDRDRIQHFGQGQTVPTNKQQTIAFQRGLCRRLRLFSVCCAVCQSLDRTRMNGRHFLSFITGYTAFVMALAALYHEATSRELATVSNEVLQNCTSLSGVSCPQILSHSLAFESFKTPTSGKGIATTNDIIAIACEKLDIVGRQFPGMHKYKQIITFVSERLNSPQREDICTSPQGTEDLVSGIGPIYLKRLAAVTLFMIEATGS